MDVLERMCEADARLAEEVARLTAEQRAELVHIVKLRTRAGEIARRLGVDPTDVFHQLQHLQRTPVERVRLGLRHGRRRRFQVPE